MTDDLGDFDGFEWDAVKSDATLAERGLDFEAAARLFEGDYVQHEDLRQDYGERRYVVTGEVEGILVTVVWTPRGRLRRIVSAWPVSNRERREYREQCGTIQRRDSKG